MAQRPPDAAEELDSDVDIMATSSLQVSCRSLNAACMSLLADSDPAWAERVNCEAAWHGRRERTLACNRIVQYQWHSSIADLIYLLFLTHQS